jgi:hypothetical protein
MGARYFSQLRKLLIIKTDFLAALEQLGNQASLQQLELMGAALKQGFPLRQLMDRFMQGHPGVKKGEVAHVFRDWFDADTGWWKEFAPEKKMREGMLRSIELRTQNARGDRPLPVSYWWSPTAERFAFVPLLSEHQLTVILLTPPTPTRLQRGKPARVAVTQGSKAKASKAKPSKAKPSKAVKPAKKPATRTKR